MLDMLEIINKIFDTLKTTIVITIPDFMANKTLIKNAHKIIEKSSRYTERPADEPRSLGISSREDEPRSLGISSREDEPRSLGISSREDEPHKVGISSREDEPHKVGISSREDEEIVTKTLTEHKFFKKGFIFGKYMYYSFFTNGNASTRVVNTLILIMSNEDKNDSKICDKLVEFYESYD
jgi:hypothetical protein